MQKTLIVRLSSFGDILQCLKVPRALKQRAPQSEVHWVVRSDFAQLLEPHPLIDRVWSFDRRRGLGGWLQLCQTLAAENFSHVYDAHNNLRSHLLGGLLALSSGAPQRLRRSKERFKRFQLFQLGRNTYSNWPYRGQHSFLQPLTDWQVVLDDPELWSAKELFFAKSTQNKVDAALAGWEDFIALAPSAAWEMKRWPLAHWRQLITSTPHRFVLLGGPQDHFCQELAALAPERGLNLAGRLQLIESCAVLERARLVISADTGILHAADQLGRPTLALIGPTAFGYPSHPNSHVLQTDLPCRPCTKDGRGRCRQDIYQRCLVEITPAQVAEKIQELSCRS